MPSRIYDGMSPEEQRALHYALGKHLGKLASEESVANQEFFSGSRFSSSLLELASDQINFIHVDNGTMAIEECIIYAHWEVSTGQRMMKELNFTAALHYFINGIKLLDEDCWFRDRDLCVQLYRGATAAAAALGKYTDIQKISSVLIAKSMLEECLEEHILYLKATVLTQPGEAISRGFVSCFSFASNCQSCTYALIHHGCFTVTFTANDSNSSKKWIFSSHHKICRTSL